MEVRRWVITHAAYEPGMMSFVIAAKSAASAWAKFCRQRFGVLKPARRDYTISGAL
jgi:hypothetical protein